MIVIAQADLVTVRTMAARIQSELMLFGACANADLAARWGYEPAEVTRLRPAAEALANRQPWRLDAEANPIRQLPIPAE